MKRRIVHMLALGTVYILVTEPILRSHPEWRGVSIAVIILLIGAIAYATRDQSPK